MALLSSAVSALNGVTDRSCAGSNEGAVSAPALVVRGLACATLFFTASGLTTTGASSVASASGIACRRKQALLFQGAARIGRPVIQLGSRADQEAAPRRPLKTREERKTRRKPAEP